MKTKCILSMFVILTVFSLIVSSAKASTIDMLVDPINIIVHAPDEVIIGESFLITVGVQSSDDLTLDDLSVEIEDAHTTVHTETLFTNLAVPSYKAPIEKTVTTSISIEGEYGILFHFTYTVDSETRTFNHVYATLGFARDVSYGDLKANYTSLNTRYNSLTWNYNTLQDSYDSLEANLNNTRTLMYVSMITTGIFIVTTIGFALRRPKAR